MTPRVYYNENDKFCAHWLYNLIQKNLIAPGDIDTRDIRDVRPSDLAGYSQHHFFAGIGGWSLALRRASWSDHRAVWTGSCPCQPFSQAGRRRGFADERHLWPHWHWLISQCRPPDVLGEQVASAAQWIGLVRGDLEALGYAVGCMPVEAASAGADHLRDRYWFVAHDEQQAEGWRGIQRPGKSNGAPAIGAPDKSSGSGFDDLAHDDGARSQGRGVLPERAAQRIARENGVANADVIIGRIGNEQPARQQPEQQRDQEARYSWVLGADGKARRVKPGVRLLVDGFPNRVGLLRGFGNAIDPRPAQAFITAAMQALDIPTTM